MPIRGQEGAAMQSFSESDVALAMSQYGGQLSRTVAKNPKLVKATFDLIKATSSGDPIGGISSVASGVSAGTKAVGASKSTQSNAKSAAFVASEVKASLDLMKITRLTSTGAALTFIGATAIQKTGIAVSLAGGNEEKAACVGALMELAGSTTTTVLLAPTGVLAVLSAVSLTASAYNAYLSCSAVK
jgi:hypothetical protein